MSNENMNLVAFPMCDVIIVNSAQNTLPVALISGINTHCSEVDAWL